MGTHSDLEDISHKDVEYGALIRCVYKGIMYLFQYESRDTLNLTCSAVVGSTIGIKGKGYFCRDITVFPLTSCYLVNARYERDRGLVGIYNNYPTV